ncbi:nascent polypeptide-associated complex subunit alpha, muscle-specific form-like [Candoia aspera]|uniref:nascent polypeptide-associated complex subunit alpha, muscle-specific form-like n=1 Tax=Candoia aspera TaxID=51853 RepID=UPI002FD8489A
MAPGPNEKRTTRERPGTLQTGLCSKATHRTAGKTHARLLRRKAQHLPCPADPPPIPAEEPSAAALRAGPAQPGSPLAPAATRPSKRALLGALRPGKRRFQASSGSSKSRGRLEPLPQRRRAAALPQRTPSPPAEGRAGWTSSRPSPRARLGLRRARSLARPPARRGDRSGGRTAPRGLPPHKAELLPSPSPRRRRAPPAGAFPDGLAPPAEEEGR